MLPAKLLNLLPYCYVDSERNPAALHEKSTGRIKVRIASRRFRVSALIRHSLTNPHRLFLFVSPGHVP